MRRLIVLASILGVCVATMMIVSVMRNSARKTLTAEARLAGMQAYHDGNYAEAIQHLSYFIARDRSDVEVLMAFAEARSKVPMANNRHLHEAAGIYSVVTDLQPQNIQAHVLRMQMNERLNRRLEWREAAERVLTLDPHNVTALRAKALAHYLESRFDEAGAACSRLIALEPDEVTWRAFYLQIMQDRGESLERIVQTCQRWIDTHATDGRYHLLQARMLSAVGQYDEGQRLALLAAQRGAHDPLVLEHLVVLLDALSLHEQATELIETTKQRLPDAQWVYEASVKRYWKAGQYQRALEELARVSQQHDRLGRGLLRWQTLLQAFAEGEQEQQHTVFARADASGEDVVDRDVDHAWVMASAAKAELESDNVLDAIRTYRQALALSPNDPILHYLIGEAYAHAGEYHHAANSLEHAVRSDPGWLTAQRLYAQVLLTLERYDEAVRLAVKLMERADGIDFQTCLILARAWYQANMTAEEVGLFIGSSDAPATLAKFLDYVHQRIPADPNVVELLALAHLREGDHDSARSVVEAALESTNLTNELLVRLMDISEAHNLQLEAAIMQAGMNRLAGGSQLAVMRARLLHRMGQVEAARQLIEQVPRTSLEQARARASYLAWAGDPSAVDALHDVLELAKSDIHSTLFVLSQPATWHDGDLARRAIAQLEEMLGQDAPQVALAKATFAIQFQADDPAAIAQAMLLTNRVLARRPDSLNARRLMSMLYLVVDPPDVEAAIRQLTYAIEAHPRQVDLYPRIVRLLQRQGDYIAADLYLGQMGQLTGTDQSLLHAELLLLEAQGDLDSIITRLSGASSTFDTTAQQLALAATWHRAGNSAQAVAVLEQLRATDPDNPAVISVAAQVYADQGQVEKGWQLLVDFEHRASSGVSAMLLGLYAQEMGDLEEAENWLQRALDRAPHRLEIHHHLARTYLSCNRFGEARAIAERGLQDDMDHVGLLTTFVTASIHMGGQERRAALRLLDRTDCRAEAAIDTLRSYDRVVEAGRRGEYSPLLLADLRELVQRHPEYTSAWRLAITAHAQAGRHEQAVSLARLATSRLPNTSEFAELATQMLIAMNQLPDALETAHIWRSRSLSRTIDADTAIAALQLDLRQYSQAAAQLSRHVERIVGEREKSPQRLTLLIQAYAADRRFEQLFQIAGQAIQDDERWPRLLLDLAQAASDEDARILQELAGVRPDSEG